MPRITVPPRSRRAPTALRTSRIRPRSPPMNVVTRAGLSVDQQSRPANAGPRGVTATSSSGYSSAVSALKSISPSGRRRRSGMWPRRPPRTVPNRGSPGATPSTSTLSVRSPRIDASSSAVMRFAPATPCQPGIGSTRGPTAVATIRSDTAPAGVPSARVARVGVEASRAELEAQLGEPPACALVLQIVDTT